MKGLYIKNLFKTSNFLKCLLRDNNLHEDINRSNFLPKSALFYSPVAPLPEVERKQNFVWSAIVYL
jgi:hypothetical protein